MISRALLLTPDAAVLLFTLGVLLIYVELNRPGSILPGCLGLLAAILSIASLLRLNLSPLAVVLFFSGTMLLFVDLLRPTLITTMAATLALILGLFRLVEGPPPLRVHPITAISCGFVLGGGTSLLTRIARRARANKAVD